MSKADILLSNRVPTTGELLGSDSDHSGEDRNTADPSGYDFSFTHLQGTDLSGSNITAGGNVYAEIVLAGGNITIGGDLNVRTSVSATGAVTAGTISSTNVLGSSINAGLGGIRQFSFPNGTVPAVVHTLTADTVISVGGVFFDGTASNGIDRPGSDAGALVSDTQVYFNIVALELDSYASPGGRVCDCVVEQGI